MTTDKIRREFDDYKYPFLEHGIDDENNQDNKADKAQAMADAVKLATELRRKYGK